VRKTDGSPAVRLGSGYGGTLSPDGRWVAALSVGPPAAIVILPTGAGSTLTLDRGPLTVFTGVSWLPDSGSVVISARESDQPPRLYVQRLNGGPPRPVSPSGYSFPAYHPTASPDGRWAAALDAEKRVAIASLTDGTARPLAGAEPGDSPVRWSADGLAVFIVARHEAAPATLWRITVATGRRERIATLEPVDSTGFLGIASVQITPDGRQVAYTTGQYLGDLYLAEGIR